MKLLGLSGGRQGWITGTSFHPPYRGQFLEREMRIFVGLD